MISLLLGEEMILQMFFMLVIRSHRSLVELEVVGGGWSFSEEAPRTS